MNEKLSNGIKGLVVLQRGEYSFDFVDKTLLVSCFEVFLAVLTRHLT